MAVDPYIDDTVRAVLTWVTPAGTPAVNIFHVDCTAIAPVSTTVLDLIKTKVDGLLSTYGTNDTGLLANLHEDCMAKVLTLTSIDHAGDVYKVYNIGLPGGVGDQDALQPDACLLTQFRTGFSGRANRGRTYGLGYCEGANDDNGRPTTAIRALVSSIWEEFRSELESADMFLSIAHFNDPGPSTTTPVAFVETALEWDRQVRRRT
jgi:hypothetical protein